MAQYDRLPWFKFFVVDWLTDPLVCSLNLAQQGLFLRLLCIQWREGSLPSDLERLRRMVGVGPSQWCLGGGDSENDLNPSPTGEDFKDRALHEFIDEAFPINRDGLRRNPKLEEIRKELLDAFDARVKGGKRAHGKPHRRMSSAQAEQKRSRTGAGVDIDSDIDSDPSLRDGMSGPLGQTAAPTNGNGNGNEKPSRKRFWWDPERKRIWGTDEARLALKAKWLERGLTPEEFQSQLAACDRWLDDNPTKRTTAANFAGRLNNWLNTYLQRVAEREGKT